MCAFASHSLTTTRAPIPPTPSCPPAGGTPGTYALAGVVNHHGGGLQSGHYTADCLNADDGKWYNFNDSRVGPSGRIDGAAAYLAFYCMV